MNQGRHHDHGLKANLLSVSGDKASRVFQIDGGVTASISSLTITGGSGGNDSGGGLENKGTLNLTDCTVSGNSAGSGGGGMANYGTATLANCSVSGNSTSRPYLFGGGFQNTGTASLTDCTVSGNSAENRQRRRPSESQQRGPGHGRDDSGQLHRQRQHRPTGRRRG